MDWLKILPDSGCFCRQNHHEDLDFKGFFELLITRE